MSRLGRLIGKVSAFRSERKIARAVKTDVRIRRQQAFVAGLIEGVAAVVPMMTIAQCEDELAGLGAMRANLGTLESGDVLAESTVEKHAAILAALDQLETALRQRVGAVN